MSPIRKLVMLTSLTLWKMYNEVVRNFVALYQKHSLTVQTDNRNIHNQNWELDTAILRFTKVQRWWVICYWSTRPKSLTDLSSNSLFTASLTKCSLQILQRDGDFLCPGRRLVFVPPATFRSAGCWGSLSLKNGCLIVVVSHGEALSPGTTSSWARWTPVATPAK